MAEPLKQTNPFDKFDEQVNPFDKFDTAGVGENPFDKFDNKPQVEPSFIEKAVTSIGKVMGGGGQTEPQMKQSVKFAKLTGREIGKNIQSPFSNFAKTTSLPSSVRKVAEFLDLPFTGLTGAGIAAGQNIGSAVENVKHGNYGTAALEATLGAGEAGLGMLNVVPAAAVTMQGFNLANKTLEEASPSTAKVVNEVLTPFSKRVQIQEDKGDTIPSWMKPAAGIADVVFQFTLFHYINKGVGVAKAKIQAERIAGKVAQKQTLSTEERKIVNEAIPKEPENIKLKLDEIQKQNILSPERSAVETPELANLPPLDLETGKPAIPIPEEVVNKSAEKSMTPDALANFSSVYEEGKQTTPAVIGELKNILGDEKFSEVAKKFKEEYNKDYPNSSPLLLGTMHEIFTRNLLREVKDYKSMTPEAQKALRQSLLNADATISKARTSDIGLESSKSETLPEKGAQSPVVASKDIAELPSAVGAISTSVESGKSLNSDIGVSPLSDVGKIENISEKSKGFFIPENVGGVTGEAYKRYTEIKSPEDALKMLDRQAELTKKLMDMSEAGDKEGVRRVLSGVEENPQLPKEMAETWLNMMENKGVENTMFPEQIRAKLEDMIQKKQSIPEQVQTAPQVIESTPSGITPADKNVSATPIQEAITSQRENPALDRSPEINRIRIEKTNDTQSYADIKKTTPNKEITIYRATLKGKYNIEAGDFVTPDREVAKFYANDLLDKGKIKEVNIVEKRVQAQDIRLHPDHQAIGVENEFIYNPKRFESENTTKPPIPESGNVIQPKLTDNVSKANPIPWMEWLKDNTKLIESRNGVEHWNSANEHYVVKDGVVNYATGNNGNNLFNKLSQERSQTPPVQEVRTEAKSEQIVPPKVTEGTGETKIRGLAKTTEAKAIVSDITKGIENLPEYNVLKNAPQIEEAANLIANDFARAKRIALGQEASPESTLPGFIYKGLEDYAIKNNDVALIRELGTSPFLSKEATTAGQFIQSLRNQDPLSPVNAIKEIIKVREESQIGKRNTVLTEKFEKQIKTLEEKLALKDEQIQKIQAEKSVRKIAREESYTTRQTKRIIKKESLDIEYAGLVNDFIKASGKITAGLDPQQTAIVIKITRNRAQKGFVSAEKIVDDLYQVLADKIEGITKKDIRDAISGYGRTSEKTRSDLVKTMNDLRQQMRIVSKIEAIESGEGISKRTVSKSAPSKELIDLKQELKSKLQESGIKEEESLLKSKERIKKTLGEIEGKIQRGDYAKVERPTTPMDAEKVRLQQELKTMRTRWNDIQKNLGETITTEEAGNIAKLSKGASEAKKKMESSPRRGLGEPATEAEIEYGRKRVAFAQYVDGLKDNANKMTWQGFKSSPLGSIIKGAGHIPGLTKSMKATFDNSGLFNQHIKTLMTHPIVWQRNARKSFQDIYRTFGGKNVMGEIVADMVSRPNFDKYKTDKLAINTIEEAFPDSRLLEKIPYLGRVHQAANTAYTGLAYRNRMDLYDLYTEIAKNSGNEVTTGLGIGEVVNSLTGRGKLGGLEKSGNAINVLLFAPRFVKSHFDVLTAHVGSKDVSPFMKKEAAKNLAKIIGSSAAVMITANAIKPGSAETDTRSSDFGSIKVGNTRFHFMGGMNSLLTLGSRLATLSSKSTTTGEVNPLNSGKFGSQSGWGVLLNFGEGKLAPVAGLARDVLKGQTYGGGRLTVGGELQNLTVPLPISNAQEFLNDPKSAPMVIGMIADGLGIFTNTYSNDPALRKVQNTILKADQEKMSELARTNFFTNARTALRNGSITRKQFDDYVKQFNELQATAKARK